MVSSSASSRLSCGSSRAAVTAATTFRRWIAFWKIPYDRPCEVEVPPSRGRTASQAYFGANLVTDYPNVKNAHIVPRTYLKNWAVDGKIAVWLVPENRRLDDQPIENVGTRRRFYRRKRPDGTEIEDIEWTLSEIESTAAPLLGSFNERWPLTRDDKLSLAVLF